jgi:hypothetical protein
MIVALLNNRKSTGESQQKIGTIGFTQLSLENSSIKLQIFQIIKFIYGFLHLFCPSNA